jgi:NADH-ubiquinone oxidoreductase chain 1
VIFFIGSVAETNRAPFDLAEAESELVSGFMTEHAAVIFVFFFLAEYASILLICILNTILFVGGYLIDYSILTYIVNFIFAGLNKLVVLDITGLFMYFDKVHQNVLSSPLGEGLIYGVTIGTKASIMVFIFI